VALRLIGSLLLERTNVQGYLSVVLHGNENVELVAMGDGLGGGEGKVIPSTGFDA
jgi:hypothetical protein